MVFVVISDIIFFDDYDATTGGQTVAIDESESSLSEAEIIEQYRGTFVNPVTEE